MTLTQDVPPRSDDAQSGQRVDLVLEGGGVKGIALAGAIEVLEERGYRANRVAGSSAGSMAGALVTAGVPATEIVRILRETDYRMFQDGPFWVRILPGKVLSVLLHNGIYRTAALAAWLEEQLGAHSSDSRTGTFADLRYRDPEKAPDANADQDDGDGNGNGDGDGEQYRLVVTASDLSAGRLRLLPDDADAFGIAPSDLRVVDAVRASVSIPLFFRPAKWKTRGGRTSWLVDGGMLSNFPVSVFDREDGELPRWPTFGLKLSARPETEFGTVNRISGPISFGKAVLNTLTGFYDRMHIEDSHAVARTIFIDTDAVRPTEFDLSDEDREMLYQQGRRAATEFLDGAGQQEAWDFEQYRSRFRGQPHRQPSAS